MTDSKKLIKLEAGLEPCELCGVECEDSYTAYYIKQWKEAENRIAETENIIKKIASIEFCLCSRHGEENCPYHISKKFMEERKWL